MILTWIIVPIINAWLDRKRPKRNYIVVNILRFIALIIHGAFVMQMEGGYLVFDYNALRNWCIVGFYFTSYWLVFEAALNFLWKEPLLYYDTQEGDSGYVDGFFKKYPKLHIPAKVLALVLAIIFYAVI